MTGTNFIYKLPIVTLDTMLEVLGRAKQDKYVESILKQIDLYNPLLIFHLDDVILDYKEYAATNYPRSKFDALIPKKVFCITYDALRTQASKDGTMLPLVSRVAKDITNVELGIIYPEVEVAIIKSKNPVLFEKIIDYCYDHSRNFDYQPLALDRLSLLLNVKESLNYSSINPRNLVWQASTLLFKIVHNDLINRARLDNAKEW